jgi:hypothetical protein
MPSILWDTIMLARCASHVACHILLGILYQSLSGIVILALYWRIVQTPCDLTSV